MVEYIVQIFGLICHRVTGGAEAEQNGNKLVADITHPMPHFVRSTDANMQSTQQSGDCL